MRHLFLGLACLASLNAQAFEYEPQFENDQICIAKAKIEPHEEIGLHRDVYPQVVIALKGGTITRLEADGRITEVQFPTGIAITRESDPEDELHRSVNNSSEPVELIIIQLKNNSSVVKNKGEDSHDISVNIRIHCPTSDELQEFVKSIPSGDAYSSSFHKWKSSFVNNMNQLLHLVESEKVFNSWWSVNVDDHLPQKVIPNSAGS